MNRLTPLHAVLALLAMVLTSAVIALWIGDPTDPGRALATLVGSELAFALAALLVLTAAGVTGELPLYLPTPRQAVGAILLGLGSLLVSASSLARLYDRVESDEHIETLLRLFTELHQQVGTVGVLALTVVLVPICEELLFRGVILRALLPRFSAVGAVVLSALLFGIVHGHPIHALVAFLLGCLAGYALVAAGTLWVAILVHATNNAAALLSGLGAATPEDGTAAVLPWWGLLPGLILLGLGALCYSSWDERNGDRRSSRSPG